MSRLLANWNVAPPLTARIELGVNGDGRMVHRSVGDCLYDILMVQPHKASPLRTSEEARQFFQFADWTKEEKVVQELARYGFCSQWNDNSLIVDRLPVETPVVPLYYQSLTGPSFMQAILAPVSLEVPPDLLSMAPHFREEWQALGEWKRDVRQASYEQLLDVNLHENIRATFAARYAKEVDSWREWSRKWQRDLSRGELKQLLQKLALYPAHYTRLSQAWNSMLL